MPPNRRFKEGISVSKYFYFEDWVTNSLIVSIFVVYSMFCGLNYSVLL
jgi:hypothetical protein